MAQVATGELCSIAHIPVLGSNRGTIDVWNRNSGIQTGGIPHAHIRDAEVAEYGIRVNQNVGLQGIGATEVGGDQKLCIVASGIGVGVRRAGIGAGISVAKVPQVLIDGRPIGIGYGTGLGKIAGGSKTNIVGVNGSNNGVWVHQDGIGHYQGAVVVGLYGKLNNVATGLCVELGRIQGVALVSISKVPSEPGNLGIVDIGQCGTLGELTELSKAHIGEIGLHQLWRRVHHGRNLGGIHTAVIGGNNQLGIVGSGLGIGVCSVCPICGISIAGIPGFSNNGGIVGISNGDLCTKGCSGTLTT